METFLALIMTPLMAVEILAGEYMIARCFERRNYFYLRFFGSAAVCVLLTVWIELVYYLITGEQFNYGTSAEAADIYFKIFYYIVIFGMTIFCVWFSFKQSFILIIVCCSTGYAIQHIASSAGMLFSVATAGLPSPWLYVAEAASWLATRAAVYGTVFAMIRQLRFEEEFYPGSKKHKIILCFLAIIAFICLSRLSYDDPDRSLFAKIAEPCYAMLCSALIIAVQLSMAKNDETNKELLSAKELLHQEREQYFMTKENIEIINEKCHDLKHQIAFLREDKSDKYISEIEKAVMIYDSTVKTGSAVLDILLTERKLQCESKGIKLTVVVNGKLLEFMDEMEVYSLFGNALSNAIESVSSLPQEERHIALKVARLGDMCSIHVENPYKGEIKFSEDLPETTRDKKWHGFGMKSMNRIVTSYGGVMAVTTENGMFSLDILMPIESK